MRHAHRIAGLLLIALFQEILYLWITRHGRDWANWHTVILALLATHILYAAALWLVPPGAARWMIWVPALAFRLTLAPVEPFLSQDLYRYRWEGQVQMRGGNPYLIVPKENPGPSPGLIPVPESPAVYGPLAELVSAGIAAGPFQDVRWWKLPAIAADLTILALLWRVSPGAAFVYAWSPLPVIEVWGHGHNDALVALAILASVLAASQAGRATHLGLAVSTKWWPALLAPSLLPVRWWPWAAAVPVFLGAPYWAGWPQAADRIRFTTGFLSGWRNNDSLYGPLLCVAGDVFRAKIVVLALLGIAAVWVARSAQPPIERALILTAAVLLLAANSHPWYLVWMLPLAALRPCWPILLWAGLSPIAYLPLAEWHRHGEWNGSPPTRWLIYLPVFGATAIAAVRSRKRSSRRE